MNNIRELRFVENTHEAFLDEVKKYVQKGAKRIALRPLSSTAKALMSEIVDAHDGVDAFLQDENSQDGVGSASAPVDLTLLCHDDAESLSKALMDLIDLEYGIVVAPITGRFYKNMPLFLISIPKAGTHLLYKLAETFGYSAAGVLRDQVCPGSWYCVEYSNSHTSARDFFINSVRRSPFGNRLHPFMRSPAVFIYRNPLDILVSEANYYHQDGKTAFAGYLQNLSFEDRLSRLVDDPWLLGSIQDRIGDFVAWLDFPNVIPISFEELVGPKGGGDGRIQASVIWSMQLKLHVPGCAERFSECLFDEHSPTFFSGQIGSYRSAFSDDAFSKFKSLDQQFMKALGYSKASLKRLVRIPERSEEFRKRYLQLSKKDFCELPVTVIPQYLGHNLVRYRNRFYAMPIGGSGVDIRTLSEEELTQFKSADHLDALKSMLCVNMPGNGLSERLAKNDLDMTNLSERLAKNDLDMTNLSERLAKNDLDMTNLSERLAKNDLDMTKLSERLEQDGVKDFLRSVRPEK